MADVRLTDRLPEVLSALRPGAEAALTAMGEAAVAAVVGQMASGYGRPVRETGSLMGDVGFAVEDGRVTVGNSLDYALPVHEGTRRLPGRPYLRDGILAAREAMRRAAEDALRQAMR